MLVFNESLPQIQYCTFEIDVQLILLYQICQLGQQNPMIEEQQIYLNTKHKFFIQT